MRGDLAKREPGWVKAMAAEASSTSASARPPRGARASCCTTARPMPTATSTSAMRSTRFSRTSSSAPRPGRLRRTLCAGLGLPRPADRAPDRKDPRQGDLPGDKVRELCRTYAAEQVERQKKDFIRLGVLGDWDNPYLTMDFQHRGGRDSRARPRCQARLRVQGPQAGELVLRLRLGAGRGGSRIPGQEVARHRRGLPLADAERARLPKPSAWRRCRQADAFMR
jgi:hypothetical protein